MAEREEQSFVDYVASEAFQQAQQNAQQQTQATPNFSFQGQQESSSMYQQPWDTAQASYSTSDFTGPFDNPSYENPSDAYGTQAGQYYYSQQAYYPFVATKDHVAAALLAIFLGVFGAHKFYLGYNNAGFIMLGATIVGSLFTFGLAAAVTGVIAFIEGIIYLTKNQAVFNAEYVYGHKEWF